jgi:site-specific DNA recombinase
VNLAAQRTLRAAIYCRISLSRYDNTVAVDEQEKLCIGLAQSHGWTVAPDHIYKDNSKSAWRRDRKRPGWDAMLRAVNQSEIDAIVVYHGDRLVRTLWDLETLIDLADKRGIRLASPTGEKNLDLPDDRYILRIEAAGNQRESDNTSRRLKWYFEKRATEGIVRLGGRGGRAFGFEPDGCTVRNDDAHMIREVAGRVLAGEPVGAVCRDLNARGYRTTVGNVWDHGALKKLMKRPRLAGLLARHGQIIGLAAWPAILERETWEAVVATLDGKATTFGYTTNARRYLLTGIALCGTCLQPVAIRHNTRSETLRGYGCINPDCARKVHRSVTHLDPYVEGHVLRRLQDPKIRERATAPDAKPLLDELARLERRREDKLLQFADDDALTADVLRVTIRRIDEQIAEARGRLAASQATHALDGLWGTTREEWARLPLARQRTAVQALVRVTILPSGRRGPGFDPDTVLIG